MEETKPAEAERTSRSLDVGLALALWLVSMVLYWPTSGYDFVYFDDPLFVINNPSVNQGFTAEGVKRVFTHADYDYWRPLCWLTHMADVEMFGLKAGGHHATSLAIHAFNAVLLYVFCLIALNNRPAAFLIAGLFAWHPQHVESVAWIAERKDVLSGFFWFGCFIFYALFVRTKVRKFYWLTLASFGLGLMSKPMIVTLPFQLLLLDVWPLRREEKIQWKPLVMEKIPFFILAIASVCFAYYAQRAAGEMAEGMVPAWTMRVGNAAIAYGDYLVRTIVPVDLGAFYPYPEKLPVAKLAASILALLGITWFGWKRRLSNPQALIGWLFFLGTIFPVVGILKVGGQASADRYTYIALTGLFWTFAVYLFPKSHELPRAGLVVGGLSLLACLVLSHKQIKHWENSITIFAHTVDVTENNLVMKNNLAMAHLKAGNVERARVLYEEIVAVRAQHFAHHYLGTIYEHLGDLDAAEFHYRASLGVYPAFVPPAMELGELLLRKGQLSEAENLILRVLKAEPKNERAAQYLAMIRSQPR
ncbi:MAG: tetratricopeptide repeat protein [Limisphaerales bacterium]